MVLFMGAVCQRVIDQATLARASEWWMTLGGREKGQTGKVSPGHMGKCLLSIKKCDIKLWYASLLEMFTFLLLYSYQPSSPRYLVQHILVFLTMCLYGGQCQYFGKTEIWHWCPPWDEEDISVRTSFNSPFSTIIKSQLVIKSKTWVYEQSPAKLMTFSSALADEHFVNFLGWRYFSLYFCH